MSPLRGFWRKGLALVSMPRMNGAWLEGLLFDVRLSLRALRRDPLYGITAVAMLALALALNATVYTIMDAMLYRGFPQVVSNDRLVYVQERTATSPCCVSYADFEVGAGRRGRSRRCRTPAAGSSRFATAMAARPISPRGW